MIRTRLQKWGLERKNKKKTSKGAETSSTGRRDYNRDEIDDGNAVLSRSAIPENPSQETADTLDSQWFYVQNRRLNDKYAANVSQSTDLWSTYLFTDPVSLALPETEAPNDNWQGFQGSDRTRRESSPWTFVQDPTQSLYDQAVSSMRDYCITYAISPESQEHIEPPVHRETMHAIFAQKVQDGLALRNMDNEKAFANVRSAFITLEYVISDPCPINLALIMSVICNLERQHAQDIQASLLKHLRDWAEKLHKSHFWTFIFDALVQSPNMVTDISLRCMRIARDELNSQLGRSNWKTLYVEERLCDCLYYMHIDGERIETRRALLAAQASFYGPCARNVLWTLSNVADDFRQQGRLAESDRAYRDALNRADVHEDYDRAKTRFAALEGLADTWVAKAGLREWPSERWEVGRYGVGVDWRALQTASDYLDSAEREALTWFDVLGHRTLRIQGKKQSLLTLKLQLGQ